MFTGIIREIGILQKREYSDGNATLTIHAPLLVPTLGPGMSVSVNGACLTVEHLFKEAFKATAVEETLKKTNLGKINVGSRINLEPALSMGDKIDGHFVSGHVDGIGEIVSKDPAQGGMIIGIGFPDDLSPLFAEKGSVTINGVSLTITKIENNVMFTVIVPFTQKNTNLSDIRQKDAVNIETDIIARYLLRIQKTSVPKTIL